MNVNKNFMRLYVLGSKEVDVVLSFCEPISENFINSLQPIITKYCVKFDKFMEDTIIEGISESWNGISEKPCQNKRRRVIIQCNKIQ
jgi:hypothetical protein